MDNLIEFDNTWICLMFEVPHYIFCPQGNRLDLKETVFCVTCQASVSQYYLPKHYNSSVYVISLKIKDFKMDFDPILGNI